MSQEPMYLVRDSTGAIYGPANVATLRAWIGEGRITGQMQVALQGTDTFVAAAHMPELAGAFSSEAAGRSLPAVGQIPATSMQPSVNRPFAGTGYPPATMIISRSSGAAVASLIFGIAGWVLFCAPCGIVAIITGHMARAAIRREPERYEGGGMAIAGLILGYLQVILTVIVIAVYILFIVLAIGAAGVAGSR